MVDSFRYTARREQRGGPYSPVKCGVVSSRWPMSPALFALLPAMNLCSGVGEGICVSDLFSEEIK